MMLARWRRNCCFLLCLLPSLMPPETGAHPLMIAPNGGDILPPGDPTAGSARSLQPCDFHGNGTCGVEDVNALLAVGPIAPEVNVVLGVSDRFDLDANGIINLNNLN